MLGFLRPWLPDHNTSLEALYVTETLRNFGLSLVGIFVPIYIYQITGNFFWLPAYILILSIPVLLLTIPVAKLLRRIGLVRGIFISNGLRLGVLAALFFAPTFLPLIAVAAFLDGLLIPLYWIPYHYIYCKRGRLGAFGKQIGLMGIVVTLLAFPAPFLGGLIISQFGFGVLYLLGMLIILLSSFPVALVGDHLEFEDVSPREVFKGVFAAGNRNFLFGMAGFKVENVVGGFLVWPIFLFTVSQSFTVLGGISSALTLVWLVAALPISALVDRLGARRSLWVGSASSTLFWGAIGFAASVPAVFGLALARTALAPFFGITPDSITYTVARSGKTLQFLVQREFWIWFGGIFGTIAVAIAWFFAPFNWPILFSVGAVGALMTVLLGYTKNK